MEKNQIKICSDPYRRHIYYYWYEENGKWSDMEKMDDSPLRAERFISQPISHVAHDIFKVIVKKLYNPTVGMNVIFEGTDDDYADLEMIKNIYFSEYNIQVIRGAKKMKTAKEVMPQVENSFENLKQYFEEYPDKKTKAAITKYEEVTRRQEIAICVMGLYSSGKSTFINSIIGQEILPSTSDPTTAKIYKIVESKECGITFWYRGEEYKCEFDDTKWRINKNPNSEIAKLITQTIQENEPKSASQYMYWTLSALNEFALKEGNKRHIQLLQCAERLCIGTGEKSEDEKIAKLLQKFRIRELVDRKELEANELGDVIKVSVNFVHSFLPLEDFSFVIYDTPGTNSQRFRDHPDMLKEALEQQTNGLPIFVTKPDGMDETDNNEIMMIVNELGGALDIPNMMLVVNKADGETDSSLRKKLQNKDDLAVTKWKAGKVFFVSSIMALGGKKENPKKKASWTDECYYSTYRGKIDQFNDPDDELYLRLYDYNILPKDSKERISKKCEELSQEELLVWNSGIPCVEEEIGIYAERNALYNKCRQAIKYLLEAAVMVEEDIQEAEKKSSELQVKIKKSLDEGKKSLIQKLKGECEKKKNQFTQTFVDQVINTYVGKYLDDVRIEEIVKDIYNSCPGKKDAEKVEMFSERIEIMLRKDIQDYSKETSAYVESFWQEHAEELKKSLLEIVVGSPHLTSEQKERLREIMLKVVEVPNYHKLLNIKYTSAIKNKDKRFLWFSMTRINIKESAIKYTEALRDDIAANNKKMTDNNDREIMLWINRLLNKLEKVITSFNPQLVRMGEDLETQKNVAAVKKEERIIIEMERKNIETLLKFEEESK